MGFNLRWNLDPFTGLPHCFVDHGVTEADVEEALERTAEDRPGEENSRIAIGATYAGTVLRIIYSPDDDGLGAFVITAYPLRGKPLAAFRRRMRKRGKR